MQRGYQEAQRSAAQDRAAVDKSQSATNSQKVEGSLEANINFENMPSWVKTQVDADKAFKKLKVTRSSPQAGKAGAGVDQSSPWTYE